MKAGASPCQLAGEPGPRAPLVEGQRGPRQTECHLPVVAELFGGALSPAAFHSAKAGKRRSITEPPPELTITSTERGHAPCGPVMAQ